MLYNAFVEAKIVKASSYRDSILKMKKAIEGREVNLERNHFCFVPDDLTLLTESLIFDNGGAFDVEVMTFNRLFSKVVSKTANYLPRYGAVMLLKSVILKCKDSLKFFAKSVGFDGFAQKLYDTIANLQSCLISPSDLAAIENDEKMHDIALIYSHYLDACGDFHIDALGRSRLLASTIKDMDLSSFSFYFAAYCEFTKQQKRIVEAIVESGAAVTIFDPCTDSFVYQDVEFYEADDVADQLKAAAVRMREKRRQGIPYKKMCVVSPSLKFEQARRIFKEFEIPFNLNEKVSLSESAVARFLKSICNCAFNAYSRADVFTLTKSFFAKVEKSDADIFENYCNSFCIDRTRFLSPFTIVDSDCLGALEVAEKVRKSIHSLVESFLVAGKDVVNATSFVSFLENLFTRLDIEKNEKELAVLCGQAWQEGKSERILEAARVLETIVTNKSTTVKELFELLSEGLDAVSINTIPAVLDAVEVAGSSAFRAGGYEHMFVIGFCDGEIPPTKLDEGILNEVDADSLKESNLILEPKVTKVNEVATNDFLSSVASAKTVFLAFSDNSEKRASVLKDEIYKNSVRHETTSSQSEQDFLYGFNPLKDEADFDKIARLCSSRGNSAELMLRSFSALNQGERALEFYSELCSALSDFNYDMHKKSSAKAPLFLSGLQDLFYLNSTASVTQIQNYFACPYSHFLGFGLRLKKRPDGKLSAIDIGQIMHKAAEIFVANGRFDNPSHDMRLIVEKIIDLNNKTLLEANKAVTERIVFESIQIASVIASQLQAGAFKSIAQEKEFSATKADALKTVFLKLKSKDISLKGTIDRVDAFLDYARVIDYKSGSGQGSKLHFKDLYFGKKIQLFVYLKILRENGYKSGGVFYFPLGVSWSDDEYTRRLSGAFNNDESVLKAYDFGLSTPKYKSTVLNARSLKDSSNASVKIASNDYAFSESELDKMSDYAIEIMLGAANEIDEGYIEASPIDSVCDYCDYKVICKNAFDETKKRESCAVTGKDIVGVIDFKDSEERYG